MNDSQRVASGAKADSLAKGSRVAKQVKSWRLNGQRQTEK
jgi:hypothetical protein